MPVLGITGGVASGKSTFSKQLADRLGARVFDADSCARNILENDFSVRDEIAGLFGAEIVNQAGRIDRSKLRDHVFADSAKRKLLEAVIHPLVRAQWMPLAAQYEEETQWMILDIPLLFETNAQRYIKRVVVVGCSRAHQRERLARYRALDAGMADHIIAAQMDLNQKTTLAQHLVWNGGSHECLQSQAAIFAEYLRQTHG